MATDPKTLRKLALRECPGIDGEALEALANHLPELRELDITEAAITAGSVSALLDKLPMQVLNISRCNGVDSSIMGALRGQGTMRELVLRGLGWVSDERLQELKSLPQMKRVRR